MSATTLPRLTAMHMELDTAPESFGELERSDAAAPVEELRHKMREEGYLFLPGYLDRAEVLAARTEIAARLTNAGLLDPAAPALELKARPDAEVAFMPELAHDNQPLLTLLYGGRMIDFWTRFLGGEVRHFDFTWMRAVAPGRGTPPHMDVVYMGRGTTNLYTAWTPLGDVPLEMGGLLVLERSHRHERLNNGYGRKDVDTYCSNKVGDEYTGMGGGGNIARHGWLSKDPIKLRANLGGRWLTTSYRAGDLLLFSVFTVHTSLDNHSDRIRVSSDTRYQLASEPVDERWIGEEPIAHGPGGKRGMIC